MKENILLEKTYQFALRIVKLCRFLNDEKHEFVISKQILNSGTPIGSQVEEAQQGENRSDFCISFRLPTNTRLKRITGSDFCTTAIMLTTNNFNRFSPIVKKFKKF